MSKIVVSLGETINTGNYSNLKLFVSIEKDVETETIEDKYTFLAETKATFVEKSPKDSFSGNSSSTLPTPTISSTLLVISSFIPAIVHFTSILTNLLNK